MFIDADWLTLLMTIDAADVNADTDASSKTRDLHHI